MERDTLSHRERVLLALQHRETDRIPIAMGGEDTPANMFPAHERCHRDYTRTVDAVEIARAKRREARHLGAKRTSRPIPGSRASGLRKRMNGEVERR